MNKKKKGKIEQGETWDDEIPEVKIEELTVFLQFVMVRTFSRRILMY